MVVKENPDRKKKQQPRYVIQIQGNSQSYTISKIIMNANKPLFSINYFTGAKETHFAHEMNLLSNIFLDWQIFGHEICGVILIKKQQTS